MTREEAISFLKQVEDILLHNNSWLESTHNPIKESFDMAIEALKICNDCVWYKERSHGKWNILQEDDNGIHEIECPFCKYSKGGRFASIGVTFHKLPPFCEVCGADMREDEEE